MKARDVMSSPVVFVRPWERVEAAAGLLVGHGFTAVPVLDDDDRLVGLATEAELVQGAGRPDDGRAAEPHRLIVEQVMKDPTVTAGPDDDIAGVVAAMLDAGERSVPVVDGRRVVGMLTGRDVLRLVSHGLLASDDVWRRRAGHSAPGGPGPTRTHDRPATDSTSVVHPGPAGHGGRMRAWVVRRPGPIADGPLDLVDLPVPEPGPGEVRVRVLACGVCRTDLHLAEGDLAPRRPSTVPGHEVVGLVEALGPGAGRFAMGDRIGIAWLRGTCGRCRWCRSGQENLCPDATFTGWDADGGYADLAVVPEAFAYRLPVWLDDAETAPLLCAGIVGYRALKRAQLPPGGRLGIYGFGASAHVVAQVAIAQGARVHVLTRSPEARKLALEIGAASAGAADAAPPEPLDSAVLFAPAGELVPAAMRALDQGGTLAVAGIHLTDVPRLSYAEELFREKQIRSVTANTRMDGDEFLRLAAALRVLPTVTRRPLAEANRVLADLAADRITGAAVLVP